MATTREKYETEIQRRQTQVDNLLLAGTQNAEAKKQLKDLDDENSASLEDFRQKLVALYKESRHYTGKEPRVFTEDEVTTYPFFNGQADDGGNPYYRVSVVQSGEDPGIAPLETPPDSTNGRWTRDRIYEPTEDVPRSEASNALAAYPDYTGEPLPSNWPGSQETGPSQCSGITQVECTSNGGTWNAVGGYCEGLSEPVCEMTLGGTYSAGSLIDDPVWVAEETAPELLRAELLEWRKELQHLFDQAYELDQMATQDFYQMVIDEIDNCISLLPAPAVFVRATGNNDPEAWGRTHVPVPGDLIYDSIELLKNYADVAVPDFVADRKQTLEEEAGFLENSHFTFINMRIHQVNGSFAKYKAIDTQESINENIILDHKKVIKQLKILLTRL